MRPLRDLRWLRRYREAVEADQAHGWHLVVYAAILAAYAMPLRQGLMGYARQTLTAVARAAAAGSLTEVEALDAVERALERAVPAMETLPGFDTPFGRRELLRS
jgi:urease accessory protein UreF